jgi:hypothetical protein
MRRFGRLTLVIVAACVGAAATASGQFVPTGFKSPSGNIHCQYFEPELRCDIAQLSAPAPPRPRDCDLEWGQAFAVSAGSRSAVRLCYGDTVMDDRLPVLAYGSVWRRGGLTCTSEQTGVTCSNALGHGFSLSRAVQRLF